MSWLEQIRKARAAKQYARRLPNRLRAGWGGSRYYTPAQIRVSVENLKLDPRFIALGYAAFLPEPEYEALKPEMPVAMGYDEAREAFQRFLPAGVSAFDAPSPAPYSMSGGQGPLG